MNPKKVKRVKAAEGQLKGNELRLIFHEGFMVPGWGKLVKIKGFHLPLIPYRD
jgi:hypothetical protein